MKCDPGLHWWAQFPVLCSVSSGLYTAWQPFSNSGLVVKPHSTFHPSLSPAVPVKCRVRSFRYLLQPVDTTAAPTIPALVSTLFWSYSQPQATNVMLAIPEVTGLLLRMCVV